LNCEVTTVNITNKNHIDLWSDNSVHYEQESHRLEKWRQWTLWTRITLTWEVTTVNITNKNHIDLRSDDSEHYEQESHWLVKWQQCTLRTRITSTWEVTTVNIKNMQEDENTCLESISPTYRCVWRYMYGLWSWFADENILQSTINKHTSNHHRVIASSRAVRVELSWCYSVTQHYITNVRCAILYRNSTILT